MIRGLFLALVLVAASAWAETTQTTQGWCSPAVADTQGNVIINCMGVDPKALQRLNELLDKKDFELKEKVTEADAWARKYRELLTAAVDDPQLQDLIRKGELEQAGAILDQRIAEKEAAIESLAEDHFQRAELFNLQFRPLDAISHYEKAHHYRPDSSEYAFEYAFALQKQNQFGQAEGIYAEILDGNAR
jgi:tetratricopeptide (TPR) repeat protein